MKDIVEVQRTETEWEHDSEGRQTKMTVTLFKPVNHTELPFRGSEVERWIKHWRNSHTEKSAQWAVIDKMLDEYRLYADTGSPLFFYVSDGGNDD